MNMFRDGLNSVSVDNNHHDEILEISDDDSEESSLTSELGDASPGKSKPSSIEENETFKSVEVGRLEIGNSSDHSIDENQIITDTYFDETVEIDDDEISENGDSALNLHGRSAGSVVPKASPKKDDINFNGDHHRVTDNDNIVPSTIKRDEESTKEEREEKLLKENSSPDILTLLDSMRKYEPREIDIKTELKCFIPPYIPAIGQVDAFLKVPRPDGVPDGLGLFVIDEPALIQSDPAVLELQLKAKMKKRRGDCVVRSIDNASKSPYDIQKWIDSVEDLHRSKPPPEVLYKFPIPNVEEVTSPFPAEMASALEHEFAGALDPELDISLEDYANLMCTLLDVPIQGGGGLSENNLINNLHFLFNLSIEHSDWSTQSDTISAL